MRAFLDRIFIETIPFRRHPSSMCIQLAAAAATTRAQWQRRVGGHARQAIPIGGGLRVSASRAAADFTLRDRKGEDNWQMMEAKSETSVRKWSAFSRELVLAFSHRSLSRELLISDNSR